MKISIIIPCHNVEKYIDDCLQSITEQTYKDIEIICVNDGSSDTTRFKISEFIETGRIETTLIDIPHSGQTAARNRGVEAARGEYLYFLDADDILLPNKIENVVDLIKKQKDYPCFIVGDYTWRPYQGNDVVKKADRRNAWYGLIASELGITSSLTIRKACLLDVNCWDKKVKSSTEYELLFRLLKNGHRYVHDPEPLVVVRERKNGSVTQKYIRLNLLRFIKLRVRILEYLKENKLLDEDLAQHIYQTLFVAIRMLYNRNPGESKKLYKDIIPKSFKPGVSTAITRKYVLAYSILGYSLSQRLWKLYRSITARVTKENPVE